MRLFLLLLCLCIPGTSFAAVIINEVAWMGNNTSANDEWIELFNTQSASVSVDGWILSDGMNLSIELTGSIPAQSYAVLERTDDASAPGSAFMLYTGALPNTGATLTLYREDDAIEDQVAGGDGWEQIGGDNMTKETAQYTSTGWITADPTPGAKNAADEQEEEIEDEEEDTGSTTQQTTTASSEKNESIELQLPDVQLALAIEAPAIAYVNQPVSFAVTPSGLGKTQLNSLVYTWNFGDFATASKKTVSHSFKHPGEYVVAVHAAFARHEQIVRKHITVLPVALTLSRDLAGNLQLHNNAKYEVNVSDYTVSDGTTSIIFPEHSIMLPNATITIPKEQFAEDIVYAQLFDQSKTLVATYYRHTDTPKPAVAYQATVAQATPANTQSTAENFVFQESVSEVTNVPSSTFVAQEATPSAATKESSKDSIPDEAMPLLGLLGIMALGIVGVYFGGSKVT